MLANMATAMRSSTFHEDSSMEWTPTNALTLTTAGAPWSRGTKRPHDAITDNASEVAFYNADYDMRFVPAIDIEHLSSLVSLLFHILAVSGKPA